MKLKGRIQPNQIVELIEPRQVGGCSSFKIQDNGNLSLFKEGVLVEFTLKKDPRNGRKCAELIQILVEESHETQIEVEEDPHKVKNIHPVENRSILDNIRQFDYGLHFYLVFNPMFNKDDFEKFQGDTQAHSFYNQLKDLHETSEEKYLYWGKIRSTETNGDLSETKYREVIKNNQKNSCDTYLYISDFTHLWVAKVEEVLFDLDENEVKKHSLNFYANNRERVEAWFKITDMTILSNRSAETIELISNLYISKKNGLNSRVDEFKDISITPYLSGLRYPLIIQDKSKEAYFGEEPEVLTKNPLIEKDKSLTSMIREHVYSYVIPKEVFAKIPHTAQREILSAEIEFSTKTVTKEDQYSKDLGVARKYLIVLEKILNDLIKKTHPPKNSMLSREDDRMLSMNYIAEAVNNGDHHYLRERHRKLHSALEKISRKQKLRIFSTIRNKKAAHLVMDERISHETLINLRREILGVGKLGFINLLYTSYYAELKDIFVLKITEDKKAA